MKKYLGILAVGLGSVLFSEGLEHGAILLATGSVSILAGTYLICREYAKLVSKTSQQVKE